MITEEENIVSSRASHSFAAEQAVSFRRSFHPRKMPSDYDYDYSSIFRTMKVGVIWGLYYIYLCINIYNITLYLPKFSRSINPADF